MEQNKREQFIIRRIGGTTYKVKVVFNESGYETIYRFYCSILDIVHTAYPFHLIFSFEPFRNALPLRHLSHKLKKHIFRLGVDFG